MASYPHASVCKFCRSSLQPEIIVFSMRSACGMLIRHVRSVPMKRMMFTIPYRTSSVLGLGFDPHRECHCVVCRHGRSVRAECWRYNPCHHLLISLQRFSFVGSESSGRTDINPVTSIGDQE
ncbi:hypothetical protein BS17DRAFT_325742 [Gyrodon lividus]|nr:hypothetical protein BS17DRAFT_325742 [Gyrodon lividus]